MARSYLSVDEYLKNLPEDQRAALERLRRTIRAAAPDAEECISYNVPGFRLEGRLLVSYGAARRHCSFYPGAHPIRVHRGELAGFSTAKGTVRFQPDRPLSAGLIRKLVRTRVAERSGGHRGSTGS